MAVVGAAKRAFNQAPLTEKRRRLRDLGETLVDVRRVKTRAQVRLRALKIAKEDGVEIPDRAIERQQGMIHEANSMLHAVAKKWAELSLELAG